MKLTTRLHDRDAAGLRYVYPVVSRRAGGVSVGINLNPNNACNWRCIYCQVPGLVAGKGPEIELDVLDQELRGMLHALLAEDYMQRCVPAGYRRLNDVAFSGNGEPTSSPRFAEAVELARRVLADAGVAGEVPLVLITNGSLVHLPEVRAGLERLGAAGGRVWYKLDSATDAGQRLLNSAPTGAERARRNLRECARLAPTWIQTMALAVDGQPPSQEERAAYLELVREAVADAWGLQGVLLYGLARASYQPEAPRLSALPAAWLEAFAAEIREAGLPVSVSV